jgi:phosphoribosylanthranilate isomerase
MSIDALGFIVTTKDIPNKIKPTLAAKTIAKLPPFVSSVLAVSLQHNTVEEVLNFCQKISPNALQIQFGGTIKEIKTIKNKLPWLKIIKATNVFGEEAMEEVKSFFEITDMFLIDNKGKLKEDKLSFNDYLKISREIVKISPKPVMLAGGLKSKNVERAIKIVRPYAVDLISGVETIPGKKDFKKVKEFIKKLLEVDRKICG